MKAEDAPRSFDHLAELVLLLLLATLWGGSYTSRESSAYGDDRPEL